MPKEWQEIGITWVRTRVVIPEAWRDLGLRLNLGAVDDRDATFINGRPIGRTDGWDKPRSYAVPADVVSWGQENEIAVAVDNGFAGGGMYRGPLELSAGEPQPSPITHAVGAPGAPVPVASVGLGGGEGPETRGQRLDRSD